MEKLAAIHSERRHSLPCSAGLLSEVLLPRSGSGNTNLDWNPPDTQPPRPTIAGHRRKHRDSP